MTVAIWRPLPWEMLTWGERLYQWWSYKVLHYRTDTGERAWL